jgi:hypothetical protein
MVSPYNYRVRMRIDGGIYLTEVREYWNFMVSKLKLCSSVSSGVVLLPNINAQFINYVYCCFDVLTRNANVAVELAFVHSLNIKQ